MRVVFKVGIFIDGLDLGGGLRLRDVSHLAVMGTEGCTEGSVEGRRRENREWGSTWRPRVDTVGVYSSLVCCSRPLGGLKGQSGEEGPGRGCPAPSTIFSKDPCGEGGARWVGALTDWLGMHVARLGALRNLEKTHQQSIWCPSSAHRVPIVGLHQRRKLVQELVDWITDLE